MAIRKIAVLGAGNGGCAAAADLTLRGYDVRLYSRSRQTLQPMLERDGIELIEAGKKGFARPRLLTTEMAEAVTDAELVMIVTPAVAHENLVAALAAHLVDGQIILLNPGHTGGSLHVAALLRRQGVKASVKLCETVTLTYICRLTGPARVEIHRRTTNLRCAAFPGKFTSEVARKINAIYPNIVAAENVLETGLSNINAIMHPAGMVGNAGRIESGQGDFFFYREGITPAIAGIMAAVDRERLQVVERLGLPPRSFVEIFYQAGLTSEEAYSSQSIYQAIHESAANRTIKAPATLDHRYLHEDVGYGLVPMSEFGKFVGVETPVIDGLIALASEITQIDYRREGLSLEKMGMADIKPDHLRSLLYDGS